MKERKNENISLLNKVGIFAGSLFVTATAVYIYSPVIGSNATDSQVTKLAANINPVTSITLDTDNLVFNITPTDAGVFESDSITATVQTNSTGGYELYFSADDDDTDMTHSDTSITNVIASDFSGTVTSSTMENNKWGYSLDNTDFSKIPTATSQAQLRNIDHFPSATEQDTAVHIGVKIASDLPSGTYSKNVKFTVLAKEIPQSVNKLSDLTYMQDPNMAQYCAETYTPSKNATKVTFDRNFVGDMVPRAVLTDSRDGKKYLVSKLADGNCWMSQNLALELVEDEPVTISNNDGTTSVATPSYSTDTQNGASWSEHDEWRSYNPQGVGRYFVDGKTPSAAPTVTGDKYAWEAAGIYYNWNAATGGSGTSDLTSGDAPSSICPKGWRIPASEGPKSFYNLFAVTYELDMLTESAGTAFRSDPFNYVIGGGYSFITSPSGLAHTGDNGNGFYWMSTAYNYDYAYRMSAKLTYIKPQGSYYKGYGFPVRCVII